VQIPVTPAPEMGGPHPRSSGCQGVHASPLAGTPANHQARKPGTHASGLIQALFRPRAPLERAKLATPGRRDGHTQRCHAACCCTVAWPTGRAERASLAGASSRHCFQVIADQQGTSRCKHPQGNSCPHPPRPGIGCSCRRLRHRPRRPVTIRRLRRGGLWVSTFGGRLMHMPCRAEHLFCLRSKPAESGWVGRRPLRACHALGSTRDHSRGQAGEARQRASLHRGPHTTSKGPAGHGAAVLSRALRCFSAHRRGCPARLRLSAQSCRRQVLAPCSATPWGLCQGEYHGKHPALARRPAAS